MLIRSSTKNTLASGRTDKMYCVLQKQLILSKKDEKTNVSVEFILENDASFLKITYDYSPKVLDDEESSKQQIIACLKRDSVVESADEWRKYLPIVNLVTLSLDDPFTYRGCAHRHAPSQEHIISENFASPGFIKGKISKGKWLLQLNVHAVVSKQCVCNIKIEAGGEEDVY